MRICQEHWDKLRKALDDRGIWHLGAKSGEDAAKNLITELEGRGAENNYDPLMSCNMMIWNQALRLGGIGMMVPDENGTNLCPVCTAMEFSKIGGPDGYRDEAHVESCWIDGPADAAFLECKERGLV